MVDLYLENNLCPVTLYIAYCLYNHFHEQDHIQMYLFVLEVWIIRSCNIPQTACFRSTRM